MLEKGGPLWGSVILSRVLGHPEFEPVNRPLFRQKEIERARASLLITEKQKREIQLHGGLIVDGKVVDPPEPPSRESEVSDDSEEYEAAEGKEEEKA